MQTPPPSVQARRAIAQTPLRQPSPLQRYRPTPGRHSVQGDLGELVLSATGGDGPAANTAFVLGPEAPHTVFARAAAFFGPAAYALVLEQDAAPALQQALPAAGWHLEEQEPALVLMDIPAGPADEADATDATDAADAADTTEAADAGGLRIAQVDTPAALETFLTVSQTARAWIPSLQAAQDADVALLVGSLDGEPVATARLTRYGTVAEILGVVTLPAHRGRGLGTAMTRAAMAEAARRGCTALTLNASELGLRLYLRLGFEPAGRYLTYLRGR